MHAFISRVLPAMLLAASAGGLAQWIGRVPYMFFRVCNTIISFGIYQCRDGASMLNTDKEDDPQ